MLSLRLKQLKVYAYNCLTFLMLVLTDTFMNAKYTFPTIFRCFQYMAVNTHIFSIENDDCSNVQDFIHHSTMSPNVQKKFLHCFSQGKNSKCHKKIFSCTLKK